MVAYINIVILGVYIQYSIGTPTLDADDIAQQMGIIRRQFEHLNQDLNQVKHKLDSTTEQNVKLMEKMNALEKDNTKLQLKVHSTSKTNAALLVRVNALEEENYDIKKTIHNFQFPDWSFDTLNGKVKTSTKEVFLDHENDTLVNEQLYSRNEEPIRMFQKLKGPKMLKKNTHLQKRLLQDTFTTASPAITRVAFSVALTGGHVLLGTHQVIEYNKVYTNIGNSYDVRHGHFIVPTTGIYLLSFTIMTATDVTAYIEMVKNGVLISQVYSTNNRNEMDTQTTVHSLQRGDIVWIRHANGGTPTLNGSGPYNTFTGVFLYDV
ncbi:Hypothetical predicted protein [Mytilus galloprovincialis]|uniref:C1q domain-containing protein n=1 Tax=Mytilus galloprovincialis TaxID=29158 RepID=A0A8B6CXT8_MYTGA|nr:Hypothetical predicted protein [Mytilus galloprovincialis]